MKTSQQFQRVNPPLLASYLLWQNDWLWGQGQIDGDNISDFKKEFNISSYKSHLVAQEVGTWLEEKFGLKD